jgi:hypothetical protein
MVDAVSKLSPAKWGVLRRFYAEIQTLSCYLDALIPSKPHPWVSEQDPSSFHRLLSHTVVASQTPIERVPKMSFDPPYCEQSEVGHKALETSPTIENLHSF